MLSWENRDQGVTIMAKILIVDDEEHIRFLYSEELTEAGYEVITAESGYKLLEKIEDEKPGPEPFMLGDGKCK